MQYSIICALHQTLIKKDEVGRTCVLGKMWDMYRIFLGWFEGKRLLERPRHKWEDDSKVNFGKEFEGVAWIHLAEDRDQWWALVNMVMNIGFHKCEVLTFKGLLLNLAN
jgi:hypothetical protein